MSRRTIDLVLDGYDDRNGLDTGASHALLERVSDGLAGETFRISMPGPVVAFGKRDVHSPGFADAVDRARAHGYSPIIRLPGGRAAVFHPLTVSFSWTLPTPSPIDGVRERFAEVADLIVRTLDRLGVPAAVGRIDGEYCPGEYSVHHAGRMKLAGIGQRLARRAAHVGGVLVVGESARAREVLVPVYDALGLVIDPDTVGAVDDVVPGLDVAAVVDAMIESLSETATLVQRKFDDATLERASELAHLHVPRSRDLA